MTDWVHAASYLGRDSENTLEEILQNPSKSFTFRRSDQVVGDGLRQER